MQNYPVRCKETDYQLIAKLATFSFINILSMLIQGFCACMR